ncbi:CDP-archaeol synthase [Labilibacter sediminis]|nr:CDP-archaeol synthase [Labilibacter sediminis]
MNNFWQRALTGFFFVLIIAGGIWFHAFSFFTVFFVVVIAGVYELYGLISHSKVNVQFFSSLLLAVGLYVSVFLIQSKISDVSILYLIIPIVSYIFIRELFKNEDKPFENIASSLLIACYIGAPFALLNVLAFDNGIYNYVLPLSVFVLVWINDTGAYLAGVTLGKHKFFERISPKKTWEGTIGGFVFTLIAASVMSMYWHELSIIQWIIFGGIISVTAVLGDLIESMFKRSIGVKDSGTIFPGHGGVLDRFDAVIFALPMAVVYLELFVR